MPLGKYSLMQYDLSVLIHHVSVRSFFGLKDWNLLVFLSYAKPRKEAQFVKNWLLLNVWNSSKLLGLILLTSRYSHGRMCVPYWIQYKNSLKYKVGCFWRFSYVYKIEPPEVFYEKRCSWKFSKIYREAPLVCEIYRNTFLTEHLCNCKFTKMGHCQQCLENTNLRSTV